MTPECRGGRAARAVPVVRRGLVGHGERLPQDIAHQLLSGLGQETALGGTTTKTAKELAICSTISVKAAEILAGFNPQMTSTGQFKTPE